MGNLGKIIVDKGFEQLPKVQKNAQSGHTGSNKKYQLKGSGCGSVDRAVTSDTSGPVIGKVYVEHCLLSTVLKRRK